MKLLPAIMIGLGAGCNAQNRSAIPNCALQCIDDGVKKATECSVQDITCVCEKFDIVQDSATDCVLKSCGKHAALNDVLPATSKLCHANLPGARTDEKSASKLGLNNEAPSLQAANAGAPMLHLDDFVMLAAGFTTFQAAY